MSKENKHTQVLLNQLSRNTSAMKRALGAMKACKIDDVNTMTLESCIKDGEAIIKKAKGE